MREQPTLLKTKGPATPELGPPVRQVRAIDDAIGGGRLSFARWEPLTLQRSAVIVPSVSTQSVLQKEFVVIVKDFVADVIAKAPLPGTRLF